MYKVICIGSASKDVFFPIENPKIIDNPEDDPTVEKLFAFEYGAKVQVDDRFEAPGGCAANTSQGLAKLGIDVACLSRIGSDKLGDWILECLKKRRVKTDLTQRDEEAKTDLSAIIVNPADGERTIFFNRDANEKIEVVPEKLEAEWVLVSALNGNWQEHMEKILEAKEKFDFNLVYNPGQGNLSQDIERVKEFGGKADVFVCNLDEAIEFVGDGSKEPEKLLGKISQMGPNYVIITDGENGAWGFDGKEVVFVEAEKVDAKDSTGAKFKHFLKMLDLTTKNS